MGKLLWCAIVMMLLVSGCGWNGTPTRENDFTPLTSITVTAQYTTIAAKTSAKLTVIGHFSGYFDKDVTNEASWVSNATDVATVISTNRVKGGDVTGSAKSAELTATVRGLSAPISIMVTPATISSVKITPETPSVPNGIPQQFKAVGTFTDGTAMTDQDITFDVAWSSTVPANADFSTVEIGKVLTHLVGTTTIGAAFTDVGNTTVTDSTLMTIIPPIVQKITIDPVNPSVLSVATRQFTAKGTYSDGTTDDITSLVSWNSSNGTLATMSGSVATTLAPGTLTISAAKDGAIGNTTLTVTGGSLSSISVTPATPVLVKDTKTRITAIGAFTNGRTRDITGAVSWEPADTGLATVTKAGGNLAWLTAVAGTSAGTKISAKVSGVTGTATLNVTTPPAPVVTSIAIAPVSPTLLTGTSTPLVATATFSNGAQQDVSALAVWKSDNEAKVSVGKSDLTAGRVTGVADTSGAALPTITATYGGKENSTTVTVTAAPAAPPTVTIGCPATVSVGNRVSCTVTATYSGLAPIDVTRDATAWTVGSENILAVADTVNQPGDVIGVSGGSTTLTATFGSITATPVTIIVAP
jgi:hypothetical protein